MSTSASKPLTDEHLAAIQARTTEGIPPTLDSSRARNPFASVAVRLLHEAQDDRVALLAEVDRLRTLYDALVRVRQSFVDVKRLELLQTEHTALREIAEWAARQEPRVDEDTYEQAYCPGCGATFSVLGLNEGDWGREVAALEHGADCAVKRARALLRTEGSHDG